MIRTRRVLGFLGFILPVIVVTSGFFLLGSVQDSLSDYSDPRSREIFVVMLLTVAILLMRYRGYDIVDNIAGKMAGIFALGVMLFSNEAGGWESVVHFVSAAGLFIVFSFFCLFLFTKTKDSRPNDLWHTLISFRFGRIKTNEPHMQAKKKRNKVYIACGIFMVLGLVFTVVYNLCWKDTIISVIKPVLTLEWLMIWAFGFAWLVKGKTFWRDKEILIGIR